MHMRRLHIALVLGLGLVLVGEAGFIVYQSRELAEAQGQRDTALQSLRDVREALHQSELQLAAARRKPPSPPSSDKAVIAQRDAKIKQLTSDLTTAQDDVSQLQQELATAGEESKKALAAAKENHQKLQAQLQNQLDTLQKQLSAEQAEVQTAHQQIADLQKKNSQLVSESGAGSRRAAEREHILNRLQSLDRRREAYLRSIADQYRSVTNRFRTMSGMLDSNRGRDSSSFSGAALDLIQNALNSADNDMQRLSDLNATAFRLEKELSKR